VASLKCGARTLAPWSLALSLLFFGCGGPAPNEYGQACSGTSPCSGALLCFAEVPPNGYCTSDCATAACGPGSVCDDALGGRYCLRECDDQSDCRGELQCFGGICRPPCTSDANCGSGTCGADQRCTGPECTTSAECPSGYVCQASRCLEPIPGEDADSDSGGELRGEGSPCTSSAQCALGACLPADRGGVCTIPCGDEDTCFGAAFSSSCGPAAIDGTVGTYCLPYREGAGAPATPCTADTECQASTCVDGQCARVCDGMEDCLLGQSCTTITWAGSSFAGCGYAPAGGAEVRTIDLGDHTIRAGTGTTDIVFATPPSAISVTLRGRQISGDALPLSFYEVEDGRGALIFSLGDLSDWIEPTIRWYPRDTEGVISMLVPNTTTDRYAFVPGRMSVSALAYTRMAGDTGSVNVHLDALVTLAPGGIATGTLNVRVHLVGVGVTAGGAPASSRVQALLTRFAEIIGQTGIAIGAVSYVDVGAADLSIIDSADGPDNELARLFSMSTGIDDNVLNLFLVREVRVGGEGFNTLGIAGGIPGPPRMHGTGHSGVVVAFDPSVVGSGTAGGTLAGHIAAHEVSHFLGLYHVTERIRACDPGEVPSASVSCAPFGGGDVLSDTTRGDTSNLMNWSIVGSGSNTGMSGGQAFVELRNPLAH
jgi:hypothetical protein